MRVVVSNGTNRFQLAPLAASLQQAGVLEAFFAAGWPVGWQARVASFFGNSPTVQRFMDRAEPIAAAKIHSFFSIEVLAQLAVSSSRYSPRVSEWFNTAAHHHYGRRAAATLPSLSFDLYHYRACFGLTSVKYAARRGAVTLCDHSIAHPRELTYTVKHRGAFPAVGEPITLDPLEQRMARDMAQADHVLVNSAFVRDTCVRAGLTPDRVHVVYWGVDDKFWDEVPAFDAAQVAGRARRTCLSAGNWQERKGVRELAEVFADGDSGQLEVAGRISPEWDRDNAMQRFLGGGRVSRLGNLSRRALAEAMMRHRVFVFPSYCEGSARVIFEAMACGCFIITTPNAGSIVQDGVHGRLISPGDAGALRAALAWVEQNSAEVARIGWQNRRVIAQSFRQTHYVNNVLALYDRLLVGRK
jgi:glycosyltransferase involved in cell wall biosynthesis